MKILIYGINYAPELTGIGKYTGEMATWLAGRGHDVRMVSAPPYYPAWEIEKGYSAWRYRKEIVDGVQVWRCPLWVPGQPTGMERIVHLLSFAVSSLPVILRQTLWRPDVILTIEPPFFCVPPALLAAKLCGAKAWLHIQDFEIDAAFELGLLSSGWMRRWVAGLEQWLMRRFDRVSTISEGMQKRLSQKGVTLKQSSLLPNWVDLKKIHPLADPSLLRRELQIPADKVVLLYAGNMGVKQGLEVVIEAAKKLQKKRELQFVLCGEGSAKEDLRRHAQGLANILWLPLQPVEKLNQLLNMADIHLLPQRADAADLVMPSKLTGMLASGRPVIATARPGTEVAHVVGDVGVVVPPGAPAALAEAILTLAQDPAKRVDSGRRGREYAENHWAFERVMTAFETQLGEIVQKAG